MHFDILNVLQFVRITFYWLKTDSLGHDIISCCWKIYRFRGFDEYFGMSELILVLVHVYGAQEMQHTLLLIPPPCWPRLLRQNSIPETQKQRENEEGFIILRIKSYFIQLHIFHSYKSTKCSVVFWSGALCKYSNVGSLCVQDKHLQGGVKKYEHIKRWFRVLLYVKS